MARVAAIRVHRHGGPEVLELDSLELEAPRAGQVAVEVAFAGVNYIDTYQRTGLYQAPLPFTPGLEGSGRVVELGEGVTDLAVGDRVAWWAGPGSYAGGAVLDAGAVVPLPEAVSDQSAATLLFQGMTAHYLATASYVIGDGDTVVVHAAAGGVGQLLTQIAKIKGAVVIATVSTPDKAEVARAAGADHVVDYGDFDTVAKELTDGRGAAAVYDGVGRDTFDRSLAALRPRGTLVLFGGSSGPVPPVDPMRLMAGGSLFLTRPTLVHFTATREEVLGRTGDLFEWLADGLLRLSVGGVYGLADAARAHDDLESRRTVGKLLLDPSGDR